MKAYQHTITQYFGGSVKQVNLYEMLRIKAYDVVGRLTFVHSFLSYNLHLLICSFIIIMGIS